MSEQYISSLYLKSLLKPATDLGVHLEKLDTIKKDLPLMWQDPSHLIPASLYLDLINEAVEKAGRGFVLYCAKFSPSWTMLPAVEEAVKYSRTIREGLFSYKRNIELIMNLGKTTIAQDVSFGLTTIGYDCPNRLAPGMDYLLELAIGRSYKFLHDLTEQPFEVKEVHFRHSGFSEEVKHIFEHYFRAPIFYNSYFDGMVVEDAQLDQPMPQYSPEGVAEAERKLQALRARVNKPANSNYPEMVKSIIKKQLENDFDYNLELVSDKLELKVHTLQRRLLKEGSSYVHQLSEARRELAEQYLLSSFTSLSSISDKLGYSNQAAFTRACHGWFGMTPRQFRYHKSTAQSTEIMSA